MRLIAILLIILTNSVWNHWLCHPPVFNYSWHLTFYTEILSYPLPSCHQTSWLTRAPKSVITLRLCLQIIIRINQWCSQFSYFNEMPKLAFKLDCRATFGEGGEILSNVCKMMETSPFWGTSNVSRLSQVGACRSPRWRRPPWVRPGKLAPLCCRSRYQRRQIYKKREGQSFRRIQQLMWVISGSIAFLTGGILSRCRLLVWMQQEHCCRLSETSFCLVIQTQVCWSRHVSQMMGQRTGIGWFKVNAVLKKWKFL